MSIRTIVALAALGVTFASQGALASNGFTPSYNESSGQFHANAPQSGKTRAQVKQELETAKRDGTYVTSGEATLFAPTKAASAAVSRDAVKAQLRRWQDNPVTADGYRQVPGEAGFVYSGTAAAATL